FEDTDYPDKVYKVVKALHWLHQAHRAWYETLANYLLENGFQRERLIRPCSSKELCKAFEKLKKDKFQMSSIDGKSASTPIDTEKPLLKDPDGEDVYLKGKPHLGLWYPKDSPFNLVAYSDSDYAGASLDRKSTTGGCQFLSCRLISWLIIDAVSSKLVLFGLTIDVVHLMLIGHKTNDVVRLQALIDRRKMIITEDTVRQALRLDDADSIDYLPNEEIFAELARMGYEKPSIKLTFYKPFFDSMEVSHSYIYLMYECEKNCLE
nr:hypothetical protein [Tanacetum cinerariifolium]